MKWFRRNPNDFGPFDWTEDMRPMFPQAAPEPWRDVPGVFLVPLLILEPFVDRGAVERVKRFESEYVTELAASIDGEGLRQPGVMKYDHAGKIRYHDGYHRLAAVETLRYFHSFPVLLQESPGVRGHGRLISEAVPEVFSVFKVGADSTLRSSNKTVMRARERNERL